MVLEFAKNFDYLESYYTNLLSLSYTQLKNRAQKQ